MYHATNIVKVIMLFHYSPSNCSVAECFQEKLIGSGKKRSATGGCGTFCAVLRTRDYVIFEHVFPYMYQSMHVSFNPQGSIVSICVCTCISTLFIQWSLLNQANLFQLSSRFT